MLLLATLLATVTVRDELDYQLQLPPDPWKFSVQWTFPSSVSSVSVRSNITCHDQFVSTLGSQIQIFDRPPEKAFDCVPSNNDSCTVNVNWTVECTLSCEKFCPEPVPLEYGWRVECVNESCRKVKVIETHDLITIAMLSFLTVLLFVTRKYWTNCESEKKRGVSRRK